MADDRVRTSEPKPDVVLQIREPPVHTCPGCGDAFRVRFRRSVLSSVRSCPPCGTQFE